MAVSTWLVALDALSGAILGLIALRLWLLARERGDPLAVLFAAGLGLLALSFPTVSASHFGWGAEPDLLYGLRLAGQTGGALVVLCAYATARLFGRARPGLAIGWALVGLSLFFAILVLLPPRGALPRGGEHLLFAQSIMVVAWGVAAALAGARTRDPTVPAAFIAFASGKLAWIALASGGGAWLVGAVYVLRFVGIGLLLRAIRPAKLPRGGAHAAA